MVTVASSNQVSKTGMEAMAGTFHISDLMPSVNTKVSVYEQMYLHKDLTTGTIHKHLNESPGWWQTLIWRSGLAEGYTTLPIPFCQAGPTDQNSPLEHTPRPPVQCSFHYNAWSTQPPCWVSNKWYWSYKLCCSFWAGPCSKAVFKPVWHTRVYQCQVYS